MLEELRRPEYVHVLLNPLPVYATAMGVLALVVALVQRSKHAQIVALLIVLIGTGSAWPVMQYGHRGADRVHAMSNEDGQHWLDVHEDRAEDCEWLFYVTAVVALAAIIAHWKFARAALPLAVLTLILSACSVAAAGWISQAGGQVRHSEFREQKD